MTRLAFIIGVFFFMVACEGSISGERVLFDFESDSELDHFHWRCHTLFSLSDEHATHGEKSLRIELYPSNYPGLAPKLEENDWRGYKALCFDIYNPEAKEVRISARIDDREGYPSYEDRYTKSFVLKPGMNNIHIPLDTLVTSGAKRRLDLRNIYRILIFLSRPEKTVVLHVDHIRLVP